MLQSAGRWGLAAAVPAAAASRQPQQFSKLVLAVRRELGLAVQVVRLVDEQRAAAGLRGRARGDNASSNRQAAFPFYKEKVTNIMCSS